MILRRNATRLSRTLFRIGTPRFPISRIALYSSKPEDSPFAQAMRDKENSKENAEYFSEEVKDETNEDEEKKQASSIGWAVGLGVLASYAYLGQAHDSPDIEGENALQAHNRRSYEAVKKSYEFFMHPPTKKLLPPLPPQLHREHTLCIELTDALTHLVWDRDLGWRVAIRPGARQLLYTLHQYFELVVFTNTPSHLAQPVIEALDNFGLFHYRLYREHHRLDKDKHFKDLSFLNRDLSKVIVVDTKSEALETHPENGLLIKSWEGEKGDNEMSKYGTFLHELVVFLSTQKIEDVRPLLAAIKSHDQNDIPKSWEMHKELMKNSNTTDLATEKKFPAIPPATLVETITGTVGALFGIGGSLVSTSSSGPKLSGSSAVSRIEKYCTDTRKMLENELASHLKNVESHREEQDQMIKKQMDEMKNSDLKLIDYITGNVPQVGDQPK